MKKHITKIRPYRVFKKDGRHYVKINNKKVYIRHAAKSNNIRNGDKQIVRVVVNNLLAQRRSRQRKAKNKPVLGIGSTSKPATAMQPASGQSSGIIDPTKITDSAGLQAPSVDPLYANANRRAQIAGAPPEPPTAHTTSNQMTIKHDYTGMSAALYDAYMYGKNEHELANQILGIKTQSNDNTTMDEGFDMSDPSTESQTPPLPTLDFLSAIPDKPVPPDGASGLPGRSEPPDGASGSDSTLIYQEATPEEQQEKQAQIDAEMEANRSHEEKQRLDKEEKQRKLDERALEASIRSEQAHRDRLEEIKRALEASLRSEKEKKHREEQAHRDRLEEEAKQAERKKQQEEQHAEERRQIEIRLQDDKRIIQERRKKEAKEAEEAEERRRKEEEEEDEADEQRRNDEINAFEDKRAEEKRKEDEDIESRAEQKRQEEADIEAEAQRKRKEEEDTEAEARKAGTAGASGAPEAVGAPGATTSSTPIGTELSNENLQLHMNRLNGINNRNFSVNDLRARILELEPGIDQTKLDTFQAGLRTKYAQLLLKYPNKIPHDIEPRPEIKALKSKLEGMSMVVIRSKVLPLFVNKNRSIEDDKTFKKISNSPKAEMVERMWDIIYADKLRGGNKEGWGLTNHSIKQEGMTSDEIAQVLKKKTHHVIPVIASDQIATLLPLVNNTTNEFGFVINSQSDKKAGMHWRAIYFNRKKAECCFFDSLVSEPTEAVMRGIKQIMHKMGDSLYFKFKVNRIKYQANTSATCGPFALRFIADMYAGKKFKVATRFIDEHVEEEKSIRKYISKWGYI